MNIKERIKRKGGFIIALAAFVLAFVLSGCAGRSADADRLNGGYLYTVQAADGSGQAPLYAYSSGSSAPYTVPDGTELETVTGEVDRNDRVAIRYEGQDVYVSRADIGGEGTPTERAEAAAQRAIRFEQFRARRRIINIIGWILIAILVAGYIFFGAKAKKRFVDYYAEKRKAFPWLEQWIQEHGDPAPLRMKKSVSTARGVIIILPVIGTIVGELFLSELIRYLFKLEGFFGDTQAISLVIIAVLMLIAFLIANSTVGRPQDETSKYGLTLECPKCGCPHSWGLTGSNVIVTKVNISKKWETTTTTIKNAPRDFIGWTMSGFKEDGTKIKNKDTKSVFVEGMSIEDYLCDNCKHTDHTEGEILSELWGSGIDQADGFCFGASPFHAGGATLSMNDNWDGQHKLAKWSGDFVKLVKANGAAAGVPAEAVTELEKRSAGYAGSYRNMDYLDAECAGEYYKSYVREFIYHYFRELPDDIRALFGLAPHKSIYAWDSEAAKEEADKDAAAKAAKKAAATTPGQKIKSFILFLIPGVVYAFGIYFAAQYILNLVITGGWELSRLHSAIFIAAAALVSAFIFEIKVWGILVLLTLIAATGYLAHFGLLESVVGVIVNMVEGLSKSK